MVSRGDGRSDERAGALPGTPIVGTSGRGPCVVDAERFEYAHAAGRFILPAPAAGGRAPGAARHAPARPHPGPRKPRHDPAHGRRLRPAGPADERLRRSVFRKDGARLHGRGVPPSAAERTDGGRPPCLPCRRDPHCGDGAVRHGVRSARGRSDAPSCRHRQRGQGICPELLAASDRQIIIPMQPRCESLNAAVAAAIVLWQMRP